MAISANSYRVLGKSMNSEIVLMLNFGVLIGWSIVLKPGMEDWSLTLSDEKYVISHAAFFMSAIIGTGFGLVFLQYIGKRKLVYFSASATVACGIMKIVLVTEEVNILSAILIARGLAGFGFGCLYPVAVGQIGDQAHKEVRGRLTGMLPVAMEFGIFLSLFYEYILGHHISAMGIMAGHSIICGLVAMASAFIFQNESYVDQLARGERTAAWNSFWRIRYQLPKEETEKEFLEMEELISDDMTQKLFQNINVVPYLFVIVAKLCVVIMSNNYMFMFVEHMLQEFTTAKMFKLLMWSLWIPRAVTSLISLSLVDKYGRKKLFLISCITTGVFLLAVGALELKMYDENKLKRGLNWSLYALTLMAQGCAGIGLIIVPDILIGEIIPYKLRKTSYLIIYSLEYLVKLTFLFTNGFYGYHVGLWILWGGVIVVGGVLVRVSLPETSKQSIREIRAIFSTE